VDCVARMIHWYITGATLKKFRPDLKATTDGMSIVDHQMYLVTKEGVWKIE